MRTENQIDILNDEAANFFAVLFNKTPIYDEIKCGTPITPLFTGVNLVFALTKMEKSNMVTREGIEPPTPTLGRWCSIR